MLFFFHLFAGLVLGLLIGDLLHDRRWVIPVIIGSVLPDLIDKPVGYIFFADLFGSGRIFMHSVFIVSALLVIGFIAWKYWNHPEVLAAALGILLHQVLDLMWEDPGAWYFPLFGFSPSGRGADYAFALLLQDFSAGSEWVFASVIASIIALYLVFRYNRKIITRHRNVWAGLLVAGSLVSGILAGVSLGIGLSLYFHLPYLYLPFPHLYRLFIFFIFFGWYDSPQFIIGGFVFLMGALLFWRMRVALTRDMAPQPDSSKR